MKRMREDDWQNTALPHIDKFRYIFTIYHVCFFHLAIVCVICTVMRLQNFADFRAPRPLDLVATVYCRKYLQFTIGGY